MSAREDWIEATDRLANSFRDLVRAIARATWRPFAYAVALVRWQLRAPLVRVAEASDGTYRVEHSRRDDFSWHRVVQRYGINDDTPAGANCYEFGLVMRAGHRARNRLVFFEGFTSRLQAASAMLEAHNRLTVKHRRERRRIDRRYGFDGGLVTIDSPATSGHDGRPTTKHGGAA